jgi:pSer/pThr/pTyr-binding forkhead associated (FHA) protein
MAMGLIIVRGPMTGQTFKLGADPVIVGRESQTADFVIADPAVSRRHCRFTREGKTYTVEDLNSTNGTSVNSELIAGAVTLTVGDLIDLGTAVTLSYENLDYANVTMLALDQGKMADMVEDIADQELFQKLQEHMKHRRHKSGSS